MSVSEAELPGDVYVWCMDPREDSDVPDYLLYLPPGPLRVRGYQVDDGSTEEAMLTAESKARDAGLLRPQDRVYRYPLHPQTWVQAVGYAARQNVVRELCRHEQRSELLLAPAGTLEEVEEALERAFQQYAEYLTQYTLQVYAREGYLVVRGQLDNGRGAWQNDLRELRDAERWGEYATPDVTMLSRLQRYASIQSTYGAFPYRALVDTLCTADSPGLGRVLVCSLRPLGAPRGVSGSYYDWFDVLSTMLLPYVPPAGRARLESMVAELMATRQASEE